MSEPLHTTKGRVPANMLLLIVLICFLMGVNWSVMKVSNQYASSLSVVFLRTLIGAICLGMWTALNRRDSLLPPPGLRLHAMVQSLLFAGHVITMYLGVHYISASRASVICYLTPFFAVLFERVFLNVRPGAKQVIGMCIAFAGIVLLFADRPANLPALASYMGDLMMIASALCWAGSSVYTRKYLTGATKAHQTILWSSATACVIAGIIALSTGELARTALTPTFALLLLYQGVLVAFVAFSLLQWLIYRYSAGLIHSFTFLTPVFGVLSGVLFLAEPAGAVMVLCLIMVCLGLLMINAKH